MRILITSEAADNARGNSVRRIDRNLLHVPAPAPRRLQSSVSAQSLYENAETTIDIEQDLPHENSRDSSTQLASLFSLLPIRWDGLVSANSNGTYDVPAAQQSFCYEETFMYGSYKDRLAKVAKETSKELKDLEAQQSEADLLFSKELQPYKGRIGRAIISVIRPVWDNTFARLGEDWVFLFILGVILATITFAIDYFTRICFEARMYLHKDLLSSTHWTLRFFAWVTVQTLLVIFSAAFCQWLAPSAAGSGIPEMKTILRGVVLKEYLTWNTLVAKIVGLATILGSGMPLGKEGPVMHMASIVSTMLMKLLGQIKGTADNEGHTFDLLAAACTMGVAVCYGAPVGGVLFSIEVTTVYFAVRNYWRGFFAAIVGSTFYSLMGVWFFDHRTIYPTFKVYYNFEFPYDVIEILPFICIGVVGGFGGSLFVFLHRRYVVFIRSSKRIKGFLQKSRLLYPVLISLTISSMTYPDALGKYMASTSTTRQQALDLFSNVTWTTLPGEEMSFEQKKILQRWVDLENPNFHLSLFIYQTVSLFHIGIASTLPVPNGILIPLFKVGAAFGRQVGELMVYLYPYGINPGSQIVPGAYAMVGAASFCAAITHTISISVIVFELTGQITYVIPIMIGVMVSNCISSMLQPSIYDSVIRIKKLPYLPDISTATSEAYNLFVEDIMVSSVVYIWYGMSYLELKRILKDNMKMKYFPLVDKHDSMILLGSVPRVELVRLLVRQISTKKRHDEARLRAITALKEHFMGADDQQDEQYGVNYVDEKETSCNTINFPKKRSGSLTNVTGTCEADSASKGAELPKTSKLLNLFPPKKPFERDETRFSVTKVGKASDPVSSEAEATANDTKTPNNLFKMMNSKLLAPFDKMKPIKRSVRLTRSNSLDSVRVPSETKPKKVKSKIAAKEELDSKKDADRNSQTSMDSEETDESPAKSTKRGFFKRRNSLSLGFLSTMVESASTSNGDHDQNYQTISVVDSKLRHAFDKMKTEVSQAASTISLFKMKKKEQNKDKEFDLTKEEREEWELEELSRDVDFNGGHIDAAPFQLVERTTLLKVHSMFSMLGMNYAYVTAIGRLIGVVALKEVRAGIEGHLKKHEPPQTPKLSTANRNRSNVPYKGMTTDGGVVFRKSPPQQHFNGKSQ